MIMNALRRRQIAVARQANSASRSAASCERGAHRGFGGVPGRQSLAAGTHVVPEVRRQALRRLGLRRERSLRPLPAGRQDLRDRRRKLGDPQEHPRQVSGEARRICGDVIRA